MSNSPLVDYVKISPNRNSPRLYDIDTITIHCVAGQCSVEVVGDIFAPTSRQASSNYAIGPDGRVGMYVEESDRAWTSSSWENDNRAVTIEVASDSFPPYAVTDAAYETLIKLVADICSRNGITQLLWENNPNLIGNTDRQNMTLHKWFANTACPGDYLHDRHYDIANRVNELLGAGYIATPGQNYVQPANDGSVDDLARRTINGEFGNGDERRSYLGDKYDAVQARVNEILNGDTRPTINSTPQPQSTDSSIDDLARRTIAGEFGNGDERRSALGSDYFAVQERVNQMLGEAPTPAGQTYVDIEDLALRTINGEFGNGDERRSYLGENYDAVQARVNELLS